MTNHHGVVHFEIPADDPDKAAEFYRQLFGWEITKFPMGEQDYWVVATGPVDENQMPTEPGMINGGLAKRMAPCQSVVNYVQVESVDDYAKKAESLGAQVLMPKMAVPQMGWFAQLKDTEGNVFGLWQNDTSAG
jgi:predicted enzyme related to lactoylglutathione lyase